MSSETFKSATTRAENTITDDGDQPYNGGPILPGCAVSMRDFFAAMVMQGLCANAGLSKHASARGYDPELVRYDFACSAYDAADAMLKARSGAKG